MRTGSSMDYNQMLVVSVFLHLLVLMIIMFLPKQKIQQKIIVPAFNIDMVDIPARRKEMPRGIPKGEAVKPQPEVAPPSEKTEEAIPAPKAEKAPAPKPEKKTAPPAPVKKLEPLKPKAASKIVEELERLDGKSKETALVKELDQLAKLKPPEPHENPEELRKRRAEPQKIPPAKFPETYKGLEELKKRRAEPQKIPPTREFPKKEELETAESEFDVLAKKSTGAREEGKEKSAAELIREFQRTAELDALKMRNLKSEAVAKKVDLAVSVGQPFSSSLHKETEAPGAGKTALPDKSADPLSLYVGLIRERVYSNWKNPLGAESKEVHVSFFLYSQGNIGKPFIEKSSGNEKLDSLAVRAIIDSDPFPAFPPDLKEPSLHMTIRFKYIS